MLLLLVFLQQTAGGLFIHNLLHDKIRKEQSPAGQNEKAKEINFACSCVDNFLMPFADAEEPPTLQNLKAHISPVDFFTERTYFTSLIFSSLRGPPVL